MREEEVEELELELPPPPVPSPFSSPRTTAEPDGGWEAGFPKVYFSVYDRLPPIIIKTPAEEATVDRTNWMTIPPEANEPA
jgi:hypothetical protein